MKKVVLVFILFFSFVFANSMRSLIDDLGNKVQIPSKPLRVASLYSWSITTVLVELGVPIVGSSSRSDKTTGINYVRGPNRLFNTTFATTGMVIYTKSL